MLRPQGSARAKPQGFRVILDVEEVDKDVVNFAISLVDDDFGFQMPADGPGGVTRESETSAQR